jgi:Ca-activated chloride channel family protein
MPDLYAGEPVIVSAQYNANAADGSIALHGRAGTTAWGTLLPTASTANQPGVGVLWARAKIDALMDAGRRGAPEAEVRSAVVDVALTHHLVSKFTSLVAVDVTPARPAGTDASTHAIAGNVPEGLTGFDQLPRTATPAAAAMLGGVLTLLAAGLLLALLRRAPRRAAATTVVLALFAVVPPLAGELLAHRSGQAPTGLHH